jgi:hypothetical protein
MPSLCSKPGKNKTKMWKSQRRFSILYVQYVCSYIFYIYVKFQCALFLNRIHISKNLVVFKGAQVWDFDVLDFNDFFIMKSL